MSDPGAEILAIAIPQIKADEGFRAHAYPDPISGAEPWSVGYGATGKAIGPTTVWTESEAAAWLEDRCDEIISDMENHMPWAFQIGAPRGAVLVNMAYQLGLRGLMDFPHMLAACQNQYWVTTSLDMLNSTWARQVPNRAARLAKQMLTGEIQS